MQQHDSITGEGIAKNLNQKSMYSYISLNFKRLAG
jgi:hypothetical protein